MKFDTTGAFVSGDFDFVTDSDGTFIAALEHAGFVRDIRPQRLQRPSGWVHPDLLIGVDMVSGSLFDGRTDRSRIRLVDVGDGQIHMPPTEDMIADRMGQWEASGRQDAAMLEQARAMLALADPVDREYLEQRIRDETVGASGLQDLEIPR